jgi:NAD(P)H-hydrate epimerase
VNRVTAPAAPTELWTRAEAAAADRHSIDVLGIPSPVLMERAALACADAVARVRAGRPVHVLCGPGNNGGDGVAIARILHARGVPVQVHLLVARRGADLEQQLAIARRCGVPVAEGLPPPLSAPAVIVDAILGTGAAPPLRPPLLDAVAWANAAPGVRVAVDLPTGVDTDTGAAPGPAVRAELTVTFQRSKPGLHVTPGRGCAGEVVVADIGLVAPAAPPRDLSEGTGSDLTGRTAADLSEETGMSAPTGTSQGLSDATESGSRPRFDGSPAQGPSVGAARRGRNGVRSVDPAPRRAPVSCVLIAPAEVRAWLAGLRPGAHKGERGHVGVVGGSAGTPGAAVLAGASALRGGAGLVTVVARDPDVQAQLIAHRPELMVTGRGDPPAPAAGALVVGPGLTDPRDREGLAALYADDPRPAVWDASALAEIADDAPAGPRVLTPHPAEAARLLSLRTGEAWTAARVQADRIAAARALSARTGAVAVLKGEGSVVAAAGRVAVAVSGSPALATAGSGDCLAGLIGALLARGLDAWAAACAGVHIHGVAGELADARRLGVVALDVADAIGRAIAALPAVHPRWPRPYLG